MMMLKKYLWLILSWPSNTSLLLLQEILGPLEVSIHIKSDEFRGEGRKFWLRSFAWLCERLSNFILPFFAQKNTIRAKCFDQYLSDIFILQMTTLYF
jgi:hypothetical protein